MDAQEFKKANIEEMDIEEVRKLVSDIQASYYIMLNAEKAMTMNASSAVTAVSDMRKEFSREMILLKTQMNAVQQKMALLEQKINLSLSESFHGGSTSGE